MLDQNPVAPAKARDPFVFDVKKAIQTILYVATRLPKQPADPYIALKVIYHADMAHLHRYGRFIFGDRYVAMNHGPVPSGAYDIVKHVRGDSSWGPECPEAKDAFRANRYSIVPFVNADLSVFSDSDRECLDEAISTYGKLSFKELKDLSHRDEAYKRADQNDYMTTESIAETAPDKDALLEYLRDPHPG